MEPTSEDIFNYYRSRYAGEIRAFVETRTDAASVDDLLQEAWSRFAIQLRDEVPREARAWLYRVVRNLLADEYRSRSRRPDFLDLDAVAEYRTAETDPFTAEEEEDFWSVLEEALDQLPPKQREVFVRNELEGETLAEIAESLGESIKTIISRKQYARRRLRDLLDEEDFNLDLPRF